MASKAQQAAAAKPRMGDSAGLRPKNGENVAEVEEQRQMRHLQLKRLKPLKPRRPSNVKVDVAGEQGQADTSEPQDDTKARKLNRSRLELRCRSRWTAIVQPFACLQIVAAYWWLFPDRVFATA